MTTDHIERWNLFTDEEFLKHAAIYRRFKNMASIEHSINIDYIVKRCDKLGYDFAPACCGKYTLTKK